MLTKTQIQKLSAKEQLACGEITVISTKKGHHSSKQIIVPEWLFDLATYTDEFIFENFQKVNGKRHIKDMSEALFTSLLLSLKANCR